jgi:hypothetical protein
MIGDQRLTSFCDFQHFLPSKHVSLVGEFFLKRVKMKNRPNPIFRGVMGGSFFPLCKVFIYVD